MKSKLIYKRISLFSPVLLIGFFIFSPHLSARENVYDWYIKEFDSEIVVGKDSSLTITERITADCGNATGKHGIFRILPERINVTDGSVRSTPVELLSITDFSGTPVKYSESRSWKDRTVTWKIGDADKTVQGVNEYEIRYRVKNAVTAFPDFDELYWNLNGNFWDIETDSFHAKIIFPEEISGDNSETDYYTGPVGSKYRNQAEYKWTSPSTLEFNSVGTLAAGDGITASVIFPKNIITPHVPGFLELYGEFLWFVLPLAALVTCFRLWWRDGRDPKVDKTVIAEYEVPENLSPMELGMMEGGGSFDNSFVTAEIVNLASQGLMDIRETNDKILLFNIKDYEFIKKPDQKREDSLTEPQKHIYKKIFNEGDKVKLSDLKTSFPKVREEVEEMGRKNIEQKGYMEKKGRKMGIIFVLAGMAASTVSIIGLIFFSFLAPYFFVSLLISGIIIFVFGIFMQKMTPVGAEINWRIKGFKLFMETVDRDRAKFYERENIFEKYLPYAIVFGITDEWIKRTKEIMGEDYLKSHAPAWYIGTNMTAFDASSFSGAMDTLSSSIANSSSSSSGSGGGGFSGGGGGGGGGGGW